MPRKQRIYTHLFPYHIYARANNQEWFYVDKDVCWAIFCECLLQASVIFDLRIHAFVLMDNHYHLIATPSEKYDLGMVMEWLQKTISKKINKVAGRTNHVFGGPYNASLIQDPQYYYQAIRYVYQNPVAAGIVGDPYLYQYSSLLSDHIPLSSPITGIETLVPIVDEDFKKYIRTIYSKEVLQIVKRAFSKATAKFSSRLSVETLRALGIKK